jgi:hypothetical protein
LFNATQIRHAVSIDEHRRPYQQYLVRPRDGVEEVWFSGVHSDIGGTFDDNSWLAEIALKWVADGAVNDLYLREGAYDAHCTLKPDYFGGRLHRMGWIWDLVGRRTRQVPPGASVHYSVELRRADPAYEYHPKLPERYRVVDDTWLSSRYTGPLHLDSLAPSR